MTHNEYHFTFRGVWSRLCDEYRYYTQRPWTLTQVGKFWDTVTAYDEVNSRLYTYDKRFTESWKLAAPYLENKTYVALDIQARSGNGTEYWSRKIDMSFVTLVDFSDFLQKCAEKKLTGTEICYNTVKITDFPLPFDDDSFNLVLSYETIEHVYQYDQFVSELSRVLTRDGVCILTCPNVGWEIVHWIAAIVNINHSEGPHRFIARKKLLHSFRKHRLRILAENSTVILPFKNRFSITLNEKLEQYLPESIKQKIALRRTFILRKQTRI
ncbi:MAG: class I SAM-dependent methyltransferase [candidate division KSB1 bacterium]|nr:class I SAM-dependent methyltransferase [candidate division KSB1 bacterium]